MGLCVSTQSKAEAADDDKKQAKPPSPKNQGPPPQENKGSDPAEGKRANSPQELNPAESSPTVDPAIINKGRKFVGNVWEHYEMLKKLGTGGYGKVLSVKEKSTGKVMAMKLVNRLRNNIDYGERFWLEVDILMKVTQFPDRPHSLLKGVEGFYDDKYYYLVTELLTGGELLDQILQEEKGSFSERKASMIMSGMLHSVKFLHSQKIVHLDLKPENFVFSCKDTEATDDSPRLLKLIDFGCARYVPDAEICNVRTGTPYYIAPEMLLRKVEKTGTVLRACDMWSMGVILFVLVTGKLPFFGETRKDILQSVLNGSYQFPSEANLSPQVQDLIAGMLNKDTNKRLTAEQALAHPWLAEIEGVSEAPVSPTVLEGIKNCYRDTNLKKALAALLVYDLTQEDKDNLKKMFESLDSDHNGVLNYVEIVAMVEKFGYDKHEANKLAARLVEEFDIDRNGVIDINEFAQIGTRGMLSINMEFVNQLFDYIDRDGNGFLTKEEIVLYFHEQPNFKMELDVLQILHEADLNHDGVISKEEFMAAMKLRERETGKPEEKQ